MSKTRILSLFVALASFVAMGAAVDTDGNAVTNGTAMGDIDMAVTTVGDFVDVITPKQIYIGTMIVSNMSGSASGGGVDGGVTTNDVYNIVTNMVPCRSAWTYSIATNGHITTPIAYLGDNLWSIGWDGQNLYAEGDEDVETLLWKVDGEEEILFTTTRISHPVNALGLATLKDLFEQIDAIKPDGSSSDKGATWIRPNDWMVKASVVSEPTVVENVSFKTNTTTACITSNSTISTMASLSADLTVEVLDEISSVETTKLLGEVRYSSDDAGTSFSGNRFTASAPGLYRVKGAAENGDERSVDVALTAYQSDEVQESVYVADADIEDKWRKAVNDQFLSDLQNSTRGSSGTAEGMSYDRWWTVRCPARPISGHTVQGYRSRNALSPHLLIAARHYGYDGNYSYLTFRDPVGNTNVTANSRGRVTGETAYDSVAIPEGWGFPLCMWALTNGFTREELSGFDFEDISIIPIADGGVLPDSCCPYFITPEALEKHFGGGKIGGWTTSQTYAGTTGPDGYGGGNYMLPAVFSLQRYVTHSLGRETWVCAYQIVSNYGSSEVRPDIFSQIMSMKESGTGGNFAPIYGGDSSGGIYIKHDGKWIMLSMFHSVGSGPALSYAIPILQKLCAQYGDTLKVISE